MMQNVPLYPLPKAPRLEEGPLIGIQYLRAAAALQVLVYHSTLAGGHPITLPGFGVPLFFVISGFIMVLVTRKSGGPLKFMRRRIGRIVPLYWIATAAAAVLPALGGSLSLRHLAASFLFLPYGGAGADIHYFPVLNVGWTLNYEMFFYAMFALSLWLPRRRRPAALTIVFIAIVVVGHVMPRGPAFVHFYTNPVILQFLVGTWLGWWWTSGRSMLWPIAACACYAAFITVAQVQDVRMGLGPACYATVLLLPVLLLERSGSRIPTVRPLQLLGDASYSLYLWHPLVISALLPLLHIERAPGVLLLPLYLGCSIAVGIASYLLLERPLIGLLAAERQARTDPLTSGA